MHSKPKKLFTRQETINSYKSQLKAKSSVPSQVFGLIPETTFSKISLPPRSLYWIPQYNLYAACDEKNFLIFDKSGKIKNSVNLFEAFRISSCLTFTYIDKYHCFALISSDLKLLLISVLLDLWKTIQLSGRINHIEYHKDLIFLGGTSKITILSLKCDTKYEIEKSLLLDPDRGFVNFTADEIKDLSLNIKWIKGMKVFKAPDLFLLWSECTVIIFNLPSCTIRAEGEDLCPGTLMTYVVYSGQQDYIIAGTTQGSIYVYKVANVFKLVHVFLGHTRSVPTLELINTQFFISASQDFTLKMWSLEHFRMIYSFDILNTDSPLSYLNLLDPYTLAYTTNTVLNIVHINLIGKLMFITVSNVRYLKLIDEKITAIGEDNSIVLYKAGKVATTIYPPPSAHDLRDIVFVNELKRVIVLLDSGVICLFSIEGETGLLERMIRTGDIMDYELRPIVSPIQCIRRVSCIPPQFDCELVFRKHSSEDSGGSQFLAMSAGKGMILFMSVDKIDRIYARFAVHRETITMIEEVKGYIITLCLGNSLVISYFKENMLIKLTKIELKSQVTFLRGLNPDKFFISFNTGQSEIIEIRENELLRLVNRELESDTQIVAIDIVQHLSVLATGTSTNLVQIWTFDKQLLHEIKFPHPISSILLLNDMVYASNKQITTTITVKDYFDEDEVEYEELTEDYFKVYVPQTEAIDEFSIAIEREKTPDKINFTSKFIEARPKTKVETAAKKKKIAAKKQKKKRNDSKAMAKGKKDAFEQMHIEMYKKVISKKIPVISGNRPVSNNTLLTRRQLTEEKIIENIRRYGDPADRIDYTGLCVVDESLYYEELAKLRGSNSMI